MPVFNGERFLAETLGSVQAQTLRELEVIVVDDGSTDGSLRRVAQIAPQATVLQQANAGVSAARNLGLLAARGRHVIFLDQDDVWHPEQLERQTAWLEQHPECGAVVCPYSFWHPVGAAYPAAATAWPADAGPQADPGFTGWVYHRFLWDCWALTSGTLMRRSAVAAAGGFDTSLPYSEDWDLWLRLSRQVQFARLCWPPVLYRQHPVQGSRTVRSRDYRVELLLRHAGLHGLASADGRAMPQDHFKRTIAKYEAEFAYQHLQVGSRWIGARCMLSAWWRYPRVWRPLMLGVLALSGWRPSRR